VSAPQDRPWAARTDGLTLHVRLTPKSSRDALEGVETLADGQTVLKARVRAVPEDGKANDALIALVAKSLKIPASRARITSGATSRHKILALEGAGAELSAKLEALAEAQKR
jgi:uncharacterized protein YggU (UPF0235/DUF167 family)